MKNENSEIIIYQTEDGLVKIDVRMGGDAHGKAMLYVKPHERHAKLAVNLAGTLSSFLIDTFNLKKVLKK